MRKFPMVQQKRRRSAFTLVELIVVITILAILGTIGFLSVQWYSANSRDSTRVTDLGLAMKSIELYQIRAGSYPTPDSSFAVTFSWGVVWYQWVFGPGVVGKLSWVGINKAPTDPLSKSQYTYSSLAYGLAYQLKADYEGDAIAYAPHLVESANAAAGNPTIAVIKGTYGGLVAQTQTGGTTYVLAVPSIITNTGTLNGPSLEILSGNSLSGTLLVHAGSNKVGLAFNPNTVVFSGSTLPTNDTASGITNMMTSLKSIYTNSVGVRTPEVSALITTATGQLVNAGTAVIKNQLGWSITTVTNTTTTTTPDCVTATLRTNNTQSVLDLPVGTWACFISSDGWIYALKASIAIPRTTGTTGVSGGSSRNYIGAVYTRNPSGTWRQTTDADDTPSAPTPRNNFYTDSGWYGAGAYWLFSDANCLSNISALTYSYQIWSGNNCSDGTTTLFWAGGAKHYINELRY